jgi:hypothetical protein
MLDDVIETDDHSLLQDTNKEPKFHNTVFLGEFLKKSCKQGKRRI